MGNISSKILNYFQPKNWPSAHLRRLVLPSILILVSLIMLDQLSKRQMQESMIFQQDAENTDYYQGKKDTLFELGERRIRPTFSENYLGLHFQYSRNKGAAFSMLSGLSDSVRKPFFHAVSVVALFLIISLFLHSKRKSWCLRLAMVLILGGAIGNVVDRMTLGYVIDFIDVEWQVFGWRHDFAVFNVADIAINVGVLLFVVDIIREWREAIALEAAKEKSTAAAS